jgi:hypothetical protein
MRAMLKICLQHLRYKCKYASPTITLISASLIFQNISKTCVGAFPAVFPFYVACLVGCLRCSCIKVADALSRSMKTIHLAAMSTYKTNVRQRVNNAQETDTFFQTVTSYLEQEHTGIKYEGYQMTDGGLLTYKNRLYIPDCDDLKRFIMDELHKRSYIGHPGYQKMITATRKQFYWPGLKKEIANYLAKCIECQQVKAEHLHPAGLLQPLPIPKWK